MDLTNQNALNILNEFVQMIPSDCLTILVGAKCDLERRVSKEEIRIAAIKYGMPYVEVSSKTKHNISLLVDLALELAV